MLIIFEINKVTTIMNLNVQLLNQGGLAATFDLAAFLVPMIAPVKKSVNHLRTVTSMRITRK